MQQTKSKTAARNKRAQTKVTAIFNAISDDASLELFRMVAAAGMNGYGNAAIKAKSKLTRKQFYSRMEVLMKVGMVKRKKGRYFLTSFGRLVNGIQLKVQKAVDIELRLRAIDSLLTSEDVPKGEHAKLIEELVGKSDRELADMLLKNT